MERSPLPTTIPTPSKASPTTPYVVPYNVVCELATEGSPPYFRHAPWRLVIDDLVFMLNNIVLLPLIFFPVGLSSRGPLFLDIRASGVVAQVVLAVISVVFTVTIVLSLSVGIPSPALVIAALVVYIWLATKLQGKELRKSVGNVALTEGHEREEWLFVNGICTTGSGAQLVANRLQQLFGRPVTAVLNRSLGIFFDLLECILQRDLFLTTPDIRIGYSHVRRAVMNPAKKRVVLIGHSQGGIIVSAWVDQLLCDFPDDVLAKVEVYTFASAANHFSRPSPTRLESAQSMPFAHVEHFANNGDFVSQFGVLSKAPQPPGLDATNATATLATLKGTFGGLIFRRMNHTGHLLLQHYLSEKVNILEDAKVKTHSQLVKYLNGQNVAK